VRAGAGRIPEQNVRGIVAAGVFALCLATGTAAPAAEPWDPGEALDTCLAAAIKERPGIVTAWRQVGGGAQPPYAVSVLNQEGKIAEATCDPGNPVNLQFSDKGGLLRYDMYQRATLPEAKARVSAPEIFAGPVRFLGMELSVGITGKPYYKYQMYLPTSHKATVEIDAVVGRLLKAEVK
jgi:hypothetical protein